MRYWSNLFTYDTWSRRDPRRASWAANRHKTAAELRPGDIVIAYVARIGWTGVYRATSRASCSTTPPASSSPRAARYQPIPRFD
jgi:hypothetical protein